ncbi:transposable element Tcb2 transposase [Trichonephila clavipes]|nr:transposable element Tcb2 transposase [Trichonephila clavipes]
MRLAEGHFGSRRPLRVLPLTPSYRHFHLEWCHARGNWTAVGWSQVIFSDKSRFYLSSDDNCVRVWRPRGERLNLACVLQRHTAATAGVMVWDVIAYNTRSPLALICCTLTAKRHSRHHSASVSQDYRRTATTLPWPVRPPDLSPVEHIWDDLGRRGGYRRSLSDLEARVQQIWNEMSQNIIQNLYASMPDHIASCIRT